MKWKNFKKSFKSMEVLLMFLVHYVDDFKVKHLCVANDMYELNFLRERFGEIDYEVIEK